MWRSTMRCTISSPAWTGWEITLTNVRPNATSHAAAMHAKQTPPKKELATYLHYDVILLSIHFPFQNCTRNYDDQAAGQPDEFP